MKTIITVVAVILSFQIFAKNGAQVPETQSVSKYTKILQSFKEMYENKHFEKHLFDMSGGYLQTSVSSNEDNMPLNFFVEYNNMWWFSVIEKIVVPVVGYDPENDAGFIALDIYYDQDHILRASQYVKFKEDKISYIRTYASPEFFSGDDPLIKLDAYGNEIWLTTGYGLKYSAEAALLFFESPKGKSFAIHAKTEAAVKSIKENLAKYLYSHRSKT